jgi:hypothetical protein
MARTTIEFTDAASVALENLSQRLGLSKTEVLRHALSLYAFVIGEITGPHKLAIVSTPDKTVEQLIAVPGVQQAVSAS